MMDEFWQLTDHEIAAGLRLAGSAEERIRAMQEHHPQVRFTWDRRLLRMAQLLEACGWDRTLMMLRHADEIQALGKIEDANWQRRIVGS
jgi:hypothetical protein